MLLQASAPTSVGILDTVFTTEFSAVVAMSIVDIRPGRCCNTGEATGGLASVSV